MASSTRFLSVAATASSVRGTNMRRLSTEPISSLARGLALDADRAGNRARRQVRKQNDMVAGLEPDLADARDLGAGGKDDDRIDARGALDVGGMGARSESGQHEQCERWAHGSILPCGRGSLARP